MDHLLYGAAYYLEYLPYDRLDQDVEMMKAAGINVVRIAESTWSTYEPREGEFNFCTVERVLDAMEAAGISVIVGTPTYAVPAWLVKKYPDVLATTKHGPRLYGPRQIMDITHPKYLFYAERIIRRLMEVSAHRKCVIGFQLDNETKYYDTAGKHVQERFVKYLREQFHDDLDAMNHEFGLNYWSNRIGAWEDFPDVRNTINGSLGGNFDLLPGAAYLYVGGDAKDPHYVFDEITAQAERLGREGIDGSFYEQIRRASYGQMIRSLNSFENIAVSMTEGYFRHFDYYHFPEVFAAVTKADVEAFLRENITPERAALSIVDPAQ